MSALQRDGTTTLQIPVIDISTGDARIADQLLDAVGQYGFAFVRGDGLGFTSQILNDAFAMVR